MVQLDLLPNYAAHVLKDDGQEMAGVKCIQVGKGGLLGPGVPNVRQVFVHIGFHYWLLRGLVSTPSERIDDFLERRTFPANEIRLYTIQIRPHSPSLL